MKLLILMMTLVPTATLATSFTTPIPSTFESVGADKQAITALLDTYMRAVTTKNQVLFETLLLNKEIPFSGIPLPAVTAEAPGGTTNYASFRKEVFEGPPFTQRFRDIQIQQDGALAQVSLVFVNTTSQQSTWGWKTMQLLKVKGKWKIAAEFYTGHP